MTVPERPLHRRGPAGCSGSLPLLLLMAALAGCSESHPHDRDTGRGEVAAPELPQGLELGEGTLFGIDTTTPLYPFAITGDPDHLLEAVLTDAAGRREIRYTTAATGAFEVVAAPDFYLPPVGLRTGTGDVVACYDRLSGADTALTEGSMPDPTQGVQLACRVRQADAWGPVMAAGAGFQAAWLSSLTEGPEGELDLDYYRDDGWFIPTDNPLHGLYRQTLRSGTLSDPVQLGPPRGF